MEVRWRNGSQFLSIDPKDAYKELEAIKESNGGVLSASAVVERAKDKQNPLHSGFDWDDNSAADHWRLHQARNMIRAIHVVRSKSSTKQSVSVYHNIVTEDPRDKTAPRKRVYMSLDDILADSEARDAMLRKALKEAVNWRKNYAALSELSQITNVIEDTVSELDPEIDLTLQKASNQ